ncbi:hypothetical protein PHSY_004394 [Pseudozyma hubeiensis SY62]|uniref:Uncharacterized protein n=1 Tax=Pseudozyma hubeiensis (strain SY62) TaxID=1305764 RepID=R9PFG3_PSEHS|nr:hypothetical protein PHSY_004394 [Pseudozyma hubeiensis SY62]GAC96810.1 hypothetical protein PHSY_004394 [Pseudozyma hubeiensis SY62]
MNPRILEPSSPHLSVGAGILPQSLGKSEFMRLVSGRHLPSLAYAHQGRLLAFVSRIVLLRRQEKLSDHRVEGIFHVRVRPSYLPNRTSAASFIESIRLSRCVFFTYGTTVQLLIYSLHRFHSSMQTTYLRPPYTHRGVTWISSDARSHSETR